VVVQILKLNVAPEKKIALPMSCDHFSDWDSLSATGLRISKLGYYTEGLEM